MRHIVLSLGAAACAAIAMAGPARAQERSRSYLAEHVRVPSSALELKIGTGYTQGFGMVAPGRGLPDVGGPGVGVSVDVDYRLRRAWSIGLEGQYQELSNQDNRSARGLAFNVGATYHFEPVLRGDPWLRLGSGYRLLWDNDPTGSPGLTVLRHGFELLTAKVGYDVRVSDDVAVAPVIGADLNVFLWEDRSDRPGAPFSPAQVGTFVYAGLQGRFDLGGERLGLEDASPPERVGVTNLQPESAPEPTPQITQAVSPSIAVSPDIVAACRLNLNDVVKAPKFEFDRDALLPTDEDVLQQIGDCFASGALKDANLVLVGRADPRGSAEYNQQLGLKRADRVAAFLHQRGVDESRIERFSRGKLDARGTDEASWAIDRRVDILER